MLRLASNGSILPIFTDDILELGRLLHQAAEVEHSLLVQYLFASFSIKDGYPALHGFPMASSSTLLGVTIQEMQHLDAVNNFLRVLGLSPNLSRQDFPWEPEIYPFPFHLEALSKRSLAKYIYTEAPAGIFDPQSPVFDQALQGDVAKFLGASPRINHVGSLYGRIIALAQSVNAKAMPGLPDLADQIGLMQSVKSDGEVGHFEFFKEVFHGTHAGFNGVVDPWGLDVTDPNFPVIPFPRDPSVLHGQPADKGAAIRGRLANLHYWLTLMFLDGYYRFGDRDLLSLAKAHMLGPLLGVGTLAAAASQGLPFDILDLGYAVAPDEKALARVCILVLGEADELVASNQALFSDFDNTQSDATRIALNGKA